MKKLPVKNQLNAGSACVRRLVLAGLVSASFMGMADECKHVLNDPLGIVALGIRADTVALVSLRVVGDEPVEESAELASAPSRVNAVLVSGAGIDDFIVMQVKDLEGVSLSVNRSSDLEKQASQGRLSVSPQLEIVSSEAKDKPEESTKEGGYKFGNFHWFLLSFVLAFAIYKITWAPWFMNSTDRVFDKFFPENVKGQTTAKPLSAPPC